MKKGVVLLLVALALVLFGWQRRAHVVDLLPAKQQDDLRCLIVGCSIERDIMITMRDGVRLATNLYFPTRFNPPYPVILVRVPYDKNQYGEGRYAGWKFAREGYVVAVQDVRGKFGSEGEFSPWYRAGEDGSDTITWLGTQQWSSGKVGAFGCSALGETQVVLATQKNPRLAAILPQGAGGAMGSADGRYTYFGVYEGGIFNLASGLGWFAKSGRKRGGLDTDPAVPINQVIGELPIADILRRHKREATDYENFVMRGPTDRWWGTRGYISDSDRFRVPALAINSWQDQTVADTLLLARRMKEQSESSFAAQNQFVIVAPGGHCYFEETAEDGVVGDLKVEGAYRDYWAIYLDWFNHWLKDGRSNYTGRAPYEFFVMQENRWLQSKQWPPEGAVQELWFLSSKGDARSRSGDGTLEREPGYEGYDEVAYDPDDPTPSRGGPICCTGNPSDRSGPVDQADVEKRDDVLVYTSGPLDKPIRLAGPVRLTLFVSSTARDTDFVARLVDVHPNGTAINVQEGALRTRYRNGFGSEDLMSRGEIYKLEIDLRAIAWRFDAGHSMRLDISNSSFPRLARNLNTGGRNYDEAAGEIAVSRVHHGAASPSALSLFILPDSAATELPRR